MEKDNIPEIAQRLYEEDGWNGSLYRNVPTKFLSVYEQKAETLLEKLNPKEIKS
jgi:hypothetical protein